MSLKPAIRRDLRRAFNNHRFERTDDGRVLLPAAGLFVGGAFKSDVNGQDARVTPNDFVYECLDDILKVYFAGGSQRTAFYIAAFSGNVTPDPATLTAANFASVQTEFTDYSETTRPVWTPGSVASQTIDNAATPATLTISVDNSTVWGYAMLTASPKSATTGLLVCASKDSAARDNLQAGDKLNVEYDLVASDAA